MRDFFDKILDTGLGLFQAKSQADAAKATAKANAAAAGQGNKTDWNKVLLYGGGALAVILVGALLLRRS